MIPELLYEVWAPASSGWSRWAKPVLFAHTDRLARASAERADVSPPTDLSWAPVADGSSAVVIDLPGPESVVFGLSLAGLGYRPVPLFNSVPSPLGELGLVGQGSVAIDMSEVVWLLVEGAEELARHGLPDAAPPAFLLDSRRRGQSQRPSRGAFDNRSVSLPTDFPSANYLAGHGIKRVLVVQPAMGQPQTDLAHTLRRWQDAGLEILVAAVSDPVAPVRIVVEKPPRFRHFWYACLARMGLRRSPLGGYGGFIPEPGSSHGYGGFG
jgi:hypothetical protein